MLRFIVALVLCVAQLFEANADGSNGGSINPGTVATGQTRIAWGDDTINNNFIGVAAEMGSWPSVFNSTQYGNTHTNTAAYWGVP